MPWNRALLYLARSRHGLDFIILYNIYIRILMRVIISIS